MRKILFTLLLAPLTFFAQKKNFTMQEAVNGLSGSLAVSNLKQLKWMGQSDRYVQAVSNDNFKGFISASAKKHQPDTVITLTELGAICELQSLSKPKSLPAIDWIDENECLFQYESHVIYCSKNDEGIFTFKQKVLLPKDAENIFFNEKKKKIAYTSKYNLFLHDGTKSHQVTSDGSENLLYGTSVHRDEFGIDHGIFWSPKSSAIAYYKMDQSMVEDYPVTDWSVIPAKAKTVKYPFAGRTSHQVKVMVYHLEKGISIPIQTGEPADQYLTNVSWSPNEEFVFIQVLNREQNKMKLNQYEAATGLLVQTLLEEQHEKYVEPQQELFFVNNEEFIYWSQRDGYMHLYLYNMNGQLVKQLTKGNWVVNEILGYNAKTKELVITSAQQSVLDKNVYSVHLGSGEIEKLNEVNGTHTASLSKSGQYLIDNYSNAEKPRVIDILTVSTGDVKNILTATNSLEKYNTAKVELRELKADDGTLLYGKLIYPTEFDASKKYPVVVYLYNGPHLQLNKNSFPMSGNLWYDYLAQHGYIVWVLDGRGSSNRGFAFESATHRELGNVEMQDQLVGVNYLKTLPFVDANRMGIHGWSYGGFMATCFMLRQPDVFKCGVAGGPVLDWSMYEVMYTERYMGTPQNNKTGYEDNKLIDKVKNLKGKLLLIHGTDDATVVWQHSVLMVKQAVSDNIQLDYFMYPGYEHNVRGKDRAHLMQKITDYFDLYLK